MAAEKEIAAGVGAPRGGIREPKSPDHTRKGPCAATVAILDAGSVVAIVASTEAARLLLLAGGGHG